MVSNVWEYFSTRVERTTVLSFSFPFFISFFFLIDEKNVSAFNNIVRTRGGRFYRVEYS